MRGPSGEGSGPALTRRDAGLVGAVVLPLLGAIPDVIMVCVAGLSGPAESAAADIAVGMGTLAGSSVMLLSVAQGLSVVLGRQDLEDGEAVEGRLSAGRKWSLRRSGVSTSRDALTAAQIAVGCCLTYLVIQVPAFFVLAGGAGSRAAGKDVEGVAALLGVLLCAALLAAYFVYSVRHTDAQAKRVALERQKHASQRAVERLVLLLEQTRAKARQGERQALLNSEQPQVDVGRMGLNWVAKARKSREQRENAAQGVSSDDAAEAEAERAVDARWERKRILAKSIALMLFGVAGVLVFSDPLVDTLGRLAAITGIPVFYVSFVATPLASNASELITSLVFAAKKEREALDVGIAACYGAAIMNATVGLGAFLLIFLYRIEHMDWVFSAEIMCILFCTVASWLVVQTSKTERGLTMPTAKGLVLISLYPLSLGVVVFLEKVVGWE